VKKVVNKTKIGDIKKKFIPQDTASFHFSPRPIQPLCLYPCLSARNQQPSIHPEKNKVEVSSHVFRSSK